MGYPPVDGRILHKKTRFSTEMRRKPCVKNTHLSQWPIHGYLFDDEFVVPADIIKDCRLWWIADGGLVEFHLDPPDAGKIMRVDLPFSTFAVALEEVTTTGTTNKVPERGGLL